MTATSPRPPPVQILTGMVMALVIAGCDGDTTPAPEANHDLLTQVQADNYRTWARPAGREERKASNAPHGGTVEVFTNAVVAEAVANKDGLGRTAWPEDATVVLEGYADLMAGDPVQIAIMQKRHGVWYWEQYQAEDLEQPRFAGRPDICVGCHSGGQDFVRSFGLPKAVEE